MKMFKFKNFLKQWYVFMFLAIIYIPMVIIVLMSLQGQTSRGNVQNNFGTWSALNYLELFKDDQFVNALINSLILGAVTTPIVVIVSTLTCFGIWKARKIQTKAVLLASNITIVSPDAITGISLLVIFSITVIPLGLNLGFFTVVLAHISFGIPYGIITIYPRMAKMNMNLVNASYDLGYNKFQTFFKVIIPYLAPAIIAGASIAFAMSLDDFIITNMVNGSFQTIGTAIYSTRKGIKAWVVTFGAFVVLITMLAVVLISIRKTIIMKKNAKKKILERGGKK